MVGIGDTSTNAALPSAGGAGQRDLAGVFTAVRTRMALVVLLFAIAGAAWWATTRTMAGMNMGPGTDLGTAGWFVGVWVVMMAAMMFPSVSPTVALYSRMTRHRSPLLPLAFVSAYIVVWGIAGLVAYALFDTGHTWFGSRLTWDNGGRWFAGGVLAVAAVYEITPFKDVCLAKCRTPLGFLLGSWRDGPAGAVRMGAGHGAWCVGCCWALMAALFALGVMSLEWMAVVAALITVEKTLPWRRVVVWGTTAVLLALAITVLVAPHSVPGLVVPAAATP